MSDIETDDDDVQDAERIQKVQDLMNDEDSLSESELDDSFETSRSNMHRDFEGDEDKGQEYDHRMQQFAQLSDNRQDGGVAKQELIENWQLITLGGLGISLVNSDPKEIIYLSLYDL